MQASVPFLRAKFKPFIYTFIIELIYNILLHQYLFIISLMCFNQAGRRKRKDIIEIKRLRIIA